LTNLGNIYTSRMHLSESIRVDQESHRLLVESVRDYAIFMIDEDGFILSWNKGAEFIKGYSAEEIIGKHISVFYTAEQNRRDAPYHNLQAAKKLGRFEEENWRVRKNGTVFWADVIFTAMKDPDGNLIGFGKVTKDMSTKKMAEEEIKRLNSQLENQLRISQSEIVDYKHALDASCIVSITDSEGRILDVNDNFCAISKYNREELLGKDHRLINSGYHSHEFMGDLWRTIQSGNAWFGVLKNRAKDGSFYWVDSAIIPFLDPSGKPFKYISIRNNVTKLKEAEEEISKINEGLDRKIKERTGELTDALEKEKVLNELKSRFLSMASHEFRTPLTTILSSISLLEHYQPADNEFKTSKHFSKVKSAVRLLTSILEDFLSLDKLEQGKVESNNTEFNLPKLIGEMLEDTDGMTRKKNQTLSVIYEAKPDICQDKGILQKVLLNLISNASKYSGEGKTIHLHIQASGRDIKISVRDEGIGIPAEAQKFIFTKYFRAGNVVDIQGTGLGLIIVQRYIDLLQGKIYFSSKENEGSVFTIEFPDLNIYSPSSSALTAISSEQFCFDV
jgi:PAS domain S-box-containing protein